MKYYINIFILFVAFNLKAQTAPVEATVSSSVVEVGEIFTYQITTSQECEFTEPDFGNLEIINGPMQSVFQGSSTVNGKTTSYKNFTYTYKLRAGKKGNFTISSTTIKCKLKKYSTEAITIQVVEATSKTQTESKSNYYFKLSADKNSVYVGEPFTLTLTFYSTRKPDQIESIFPGSADGLWRKDLKPNRASYNMTQQNIQGVRFYILELTQEVCIPYRSGKITIEPYSASLIHSIDFFNNTREDGQSNSVTIDVKKLSADEPENFNGLVGNFNMSCTVSKTKLSQGQSLELQLIISGTGNLNAFDEPILNFPEGFSVTAEDPIDETVVTAQGMKGDIIYNFIITANEEGSFDISPFSFSYFNLAKKSFEEVKAKDITIEVEKGDENYGKIYTEQKSVDPEITDIKFIHQTKGVSFSYHEFLFGSTPYLILLTLPPFIVLLILIIRRKKKNITAEEKAESNKKTAGKAASKSLSKCSSVLKSGKDREAVKLLQSTLVQYLMTKLELSLSSLSLKSITLELEKRKADTNLILAFTTIWKKIEMAQYAPVSSQNLEELIKDTKKLIDELDDKI